MVVQYCNLSIQEAETGERPGSGQPGLRGEPLSQNTKIITFFLRQFHGPSHFHLGSEALAMESGQQKFSCMEAWQ
jgi:hypothetical protein